MRYDWALKIGSTFAIALTAGALALTAADRPDGNAKRARLDAYGDPLPPGAIARFGSLRWRVPCGIGTLAVSPDGKRVATIDSDGGVATWDLATGRQLHELVGSGAVKGGLAFSPDGCYLAVGFRMKRRKGAATDCLVRVWEVSSGKERLCLPRQRGSVLDVAFTRDGTALISSEDNQPVIVRGFTSGKKLREFAVEQEHCHRFVLSPNGKWLAVSDCSRALSIYSFHTGRRLFQIKAGELVCMRFSADSRSLITVEDGKLSCWELATGKRRLHTDMPNANGIQMHPAPDGRKIAITHTLCKIGWLEASTGKPLVSWSRLRDWVDSMAFLPDGRTIVSVGWGALRVRDADSGKVLRGPSAPFHPCYSLAFSPDGRTLVVGSEDLHVLDARTLQERFRFRARANWLSPTDRWESVEVSPDGKLAAAIGPKGEIALVDIHTGKLVRALQRSKWEAEHLAFSTDGKKLYAVGFRDALLRVWNVQSGDEGFPLCSDLVRPNCGSANLTVDRRGAKLATITGGPKACCRIWNLHTGREEPGLPDQPQKILFAPGGKVLAAYHPEGHINLWDVTRRVRLRRLNVNPGGLSAWTFSADGRLLVIGDSDGSFSTWRLADGKKVAHAPGHPGAITAFACSPDGKGLVSACTGCTVLRWEASAWQGK